MKKFDDKWKECVDRAERPSLRSETMPSGFYDKVMRRCTPPAVYEWNTEGLWLQFGLRTLAGVSLVLLILSMFQWHPGSGGQLLPPPIEKSIVNTSILL